METVKVTWQMTVLRLHLWMHLKNVNVIVIVFVFFFVIVFVIVMIPTQKSNGELLVCIRNGDSWLVGVNFYVFWLCFCLCLCHCHCLFLTQKSNWKLLVCITNSDPGLADINVDVFWFSNLVPRILDTGHGKGGLENIEIACKCKYGNAKMKISKNKHRPSVIDSTPWLDPDLAFHQGSGIPSGAVAVCGSCHNKG